MRIQLIHPPHPDAIEDRLDVPLGLLCVASSLRKEGHDIDVCDLSGMKKKEEWNITEADLYGITSYIPTMSLSAEIARACKEKNPKAKIVGGGANFTGLIKSSLECLVPEIFDSIIVGPGELAMLDLVSDMPDINYIYEHPLDKNLDCYPNPNYESIDLSSYNRKIGDSLSLSMLTSRGCPFRCAFCSIYTLYKHMSYRSPKAVAKEISHIIETYGIRSFNFQDDTFLIDKKRTSELLRLLTPLGISFRCHGRVGLDTKEDYQRLKEAGCTQICWGIESGSQFILDRMNKNITIEQNKQVIRWARELEILDRVFIITGFPGENKDTLEETKRFIEETNPSQYFISSFQPYPRTDVWNSPKKYGVKRIYYDFSQYLQTFGDGMKGKCNIDTIWTSREEMAGLENDFRGWMSYRKSRGPMQEYEKKIERLKSRRHESPRRDLGGGI